MTEKDRQETFDALNAMMQCYGHLKVAIMLADTDGISEPYKRQIEIWKQEVEKCCGSYQKILRFIADADVEETKLAEGEG